MKRSTIQEYLAGLKGKRVAVIGIGVSNTPLIKMLLRAGVKVTACDKKPMSAFAGLAEELESLGATLKLGEDYLEDLDFEVIFRTPGMRPDLPQLVAAQQRGAILTSEMEVFFQVCPCRTVAVTGSDGKTTTTTIIAELLKAAGRTVYLGGNIGKPLLPDADGMEPGDVAVLELSSFQLMTMDRSPDIAVVTNLAPNHLDVHLDMNEYVDAKKNILRYQDADGLSVLNYDNEITRKFAEETQGRLTFFSRTAQLPNGVFLKNDAIWIADEGETAEYAECYGLDIVGYIEALNVDGSLPCFIVEDGSIHYRFPFNEYDYTDYITNECDPGVREHVESTLRAIYERRMGRAAPRIPEEVTA